MTDNTKLLTIKEVADILRVHRTTVARLLLDGALPCVMVRSRKLVRLQDVHRFIDSQIGV